MKTARSLIFAVIVVSAAAFGVAGNQPVQDTILPAPQLCGGCPPPVCTPILCPQ